MGAIELTGAIEDSAEISDTLRAPAAPLVSLVQKFTDSIVVSEELDRRLSALGVELPPPIASRGQGE